METVKNNQDSVTTIHGDSYKGVKYNSVNVEGLDIFYREAGSPANPTLLLLHGFPTSSHMFRNLISDLKDRYHLTFPHERIPDPIVCEVAKKFEVTFSIRRAMGLWKAAFFRIKRLQPDPGQNADWNRGRYLGRRDAVMLQPFDLKQGGFFRLVVFRAGRE